jgi:hypothetical protein
MPTLEEELEHLAQADQHILVGELRVGRASGRGGTDRS